MLPTILFINVKDRHSPGPESDTNLPWGEEINTAEERKELEKKKKRTETDGGNMRRNTEEE